MLLVLPKTHMSQEAMWEGGMIARVGAVAIQMGKSLCPGGFRLLSNLGRDAVQSQQHAHLHVIGGRQLGMYI
jgi:histidine triad (HIT) family protein